jgi:hypothetical protein
VLKAPALLLEVRPLSIERRLGHPPTHEVAHGSADLDDALIPRGGQQPGQAARPATARRGG